MIKKTLYFGSPYYLRMRDEQLIVELTEAKELLEKDKSRSIPIEDIGVVILDHWQITITQPLINKLLENNVALITCDNKHLPIGLMLNLNGNSLQAKRFQHQLESTLPLRKQMWQQTVKQKIANQASILGLHGVNTDPLEYFEKNTKSGDPDNYEGRAAAYYWQHFFQGYVADFTRGREDEHPNDLLNYGYAILRAVVARSLVASGLIPSLGIHHRNQYNAYCLADDIMEPYRPYVDKTILQWVKTNPKDLSLNKKAKEQLLSIPVIDVTIDGQSSPLMNAVQRTTASVYACFEGTERKILYPKLTHV